MQSSIFDIFGEESRDLPSRKQHFGKSTGFQILKGPDTENLRAKSASVADHPSKNALGNIGNSQRKSKSKALQEKTKPNNDEENALSNLLMKTPLHKSKISIQTPNVKPVIRSPLSDLFPKHRSVVPISQQPKQTMQTRNSKLEIIEDLINDDDYDLSYWKPDELLPEDDDYIDILPKSNHRSDAEIYRLVNFWEMSKNTRIDSESDEDVAVEDNTDFPYRPEYCLHTVVEEPFSVPIISDDDL